MKWLNIGLDLGEIEKGGWSIVQCQRGKNSKSGRKNRLKARKGRTQREERKEERRGRKEKEWRRERGMETCQPRKEPLSVQS